MGSSVVFSKSAVSKKALERIGSPFPKMKGSSRLLPGAKLNLTLRMPSFSAVSTLP
jgi:hypothetical protein